jgi:hypothetical protein
MAEDDLSAVRFMMSEFLGLKKEGFTVNDTIAAFPGVMITDSKNVWDAIGRDASFLGMKEKMEGLDLRSYRERCAWRNTSTRWVHGDANLANSLTKAGEMHQLDTYFARGQRYRIVYDPSYESAKKRRARKVPFLSSGDLQEDIVVQKFGDLCQDLPESSFTSVPTELETYPQCDC